MRLTDRDKEVLDLFDERPSWTVGGAAERLEVSREGLRKNFTKLTKAGYLVRYPVRRADLEASAGARGRPTRNVYRRSERGNLRPVFTGLLDLVAQAVEVGRGCQRHEVGGLRPCCEEIRDPLSPGVMIRVPGRHLYPEEVELHQETVVYMVHLLDELGVGDEFMLDADWKEPLPFGPMRVVPMPPGTFRDMHNGIIPVVRPRDRGLGSSRRPGK